MGVPPPGWRDDGSGRLRYWDGMFWSDLGPDGSGPPDEAVVAERMPVAGVVPVVVVAVEGAIVGLDVPTGKVLWERPFAGTGGRIDLELAAGRVFAAAGASGKAPLLCLDQDTGAVRWAATFEEPGDDAPGLFLAGGHLLVHGQVSVACFTIDGERLWTYERPGDHWLPSGGTAPTSWAVALDDRVHRIYPSPRR